MFLNCIIVGAGGFIGSVFRYLIGTIDFLNRGAFPFSTFIANILGAIVIGMVIKSSETYQWMNSSMLLFLKVGLCGGFTTFSSFSLESLGLLEAGKYGTCALYIMASVAICILGVYLGKGIIGAINPA